MSTKRTLLLASVALAAMAAAIPAAASAETGTWTKNHEKLKEDATVELTGGIEIVIASFGSYGCEVHVEATLTEEWGRKISVKTGKGHINKFEVTTDTCVGSGLLEGCALSSHGLTGMPWPLTATKEDIDVPKALNLDPKFSGCATSEVQITIPQLTLTPDSTSTAKSLALSGEATAHASGFPLTAGVVGTLNFAPASSGIYGVHQMTKKEEEEEEEQATEEESTE